MSIWDKFKEAPPSAEGLFDGIIEPSLSAAGLFDDVFEPLTPEYLEFPKDTTPMFLEGDVRKMLGWLPDGCVQTCITSPPYWGLRGYQTEPQIWGGDKTCVHEWIAAPPRLQRTSNDIKDVDSIQANHTANAFDINGGAFCKCDAWRGEFGLEPTMELYVQHSVEIFHEVKRVLRDDGTFWLNIGDSYNAAGREGHGTRIGYKQQTNRASAEGADDVRPSALNLKPKDLCGIPWRVALALQADGWYLRSDIIWAKQNCMPEPVRDRPTRAHEYILLLSKSADYFWDCDAIAEPIAEASRERARMALRNNEHFDPDTHKSQNGVQTPKEVFLSSVNATILNETKNTRSVWTMPTASYKGAHFAVFTEELPERCIKAGTPEHGCCSICLFPYERSYDDIDVRHWLDDRPGHSGGKQEAIFGGDRNDNVSGELVPKKRVFKGWVPTCKHAGAPVIPSIVLDPFGGSGTTGLVAQRLGRRSVLVELNPEYVLMAKRRVGILPRDPKHAQLDKFGGE